MPQRKKRQLAVLQLRIIQVLWDRGEATVSEVREALAGERPLAYTTVATMLSKMEQNGQVAHRSVGRVNVYRPLLAREEVSRSMVRDLAARLFDGDVAQMVSHLLDDDVTREELESLKALIRRKEREARDA